MASALTIEPTTSFADNLSEICPRGRHHDGTAKDQLMAQLKTDDLGWRFDFTKEQVDGFYAELSRAVESP